MATTFEQLTAGPTPQTFDEYCVAKQAECDRLSGLADFLASGIREALEAGGIGVAYAISLEDAGLLYRTLKEHLDDVTEDEDEES